MIMRYTSWMIVCVSCLLALTTLPIQAQETIRPADPVELAIKEIGVAQGLSQGMIHALDVDHQGYLWVGTKDGLNRYDGNHFQVFRHDPHDTNSIASNYIRSLHVDDQGLIWVGTNDSGLDLYLPEKAEFIHFGTTLNPSSTSRIQSVSAIFCDPSGKILIWDGTGEQCELLIPVPGKKPESIDAWQIKSLEQVYHIQADTPRPSMNEMLGFGTDGALLMMHQQKLYAIYPDHVNTWLPDFLKNHVVPDSLNSVYTVQYFLDDQRRLYCKSTTEKLIYKWDEKMGSLQKWLRLPPGDSLWTSHFFVDHHDRLWQNAAKTPMSLIDPYQATIQEMKVTRYHFSGTPVTDYTIMCEDHYHNLWAGTSGNGIVKISSRNDQFARFSPDAQDKLGMRVVRNGFSFKIHDQFTIGRQKILRQQVEAARLMIISPYVEDDQQILWCIAFELSNEQHFLLRINEKDFTFSSQPFELCNQFLAENYAAIMIDRHGVMWLGAECVEGKAQLIRLYLSSGKQDTFDFPVQVVRNEHSFITDWYVDDQNLFWIGTKQGLFVFDPSTSQWKLFHVDPQRTDALSHNHILSICPDPKSPGQYLWIGTDGGGLNKMDIKTETFHHYTTADGLPNNVIYAVQSDKHDKLWLSTNQGLCRFDPENEEVWSFTVEDGLPGNEFNRLEYGKTTDGHLYFGGVEGITIFDPEVFYASADSSTIVINRLKLSNKEVNYSSANDHQSANEYHLPAPMELCHELIFPYTERMISLGFSLLDFTNPVGNKYRYKLQGFNDEWIDAGDLNEAVFTNLNPGTYSFMVSGLNSDKVWSAPAKLQLVILSPWWATWWFRIIILVLIVIGIYAFYRYRLQQAMKIQHLRNRIAADLHDEIGSTLSSISLAGTVIQHKLKGNNPEVDGLLDKINHNTQGMMEAMSDIVWAVNTKNDLFEQVLHRMRAFAGEILEPNDVMVHFESNPGLSQLQLNMQQRKNLYLIFKEVIHNAAKYSSCHNVWVGLQYTHGNLVMEIRDDGVGFVMHPLKVDGLKAESDRFSSGMGGNGIQNMQQRASELNGKLEINSSPGHGTLVKLTFAI